MYLKIFVLSAFVAFNTLAESVKEDNSKILELKVRQLNDLFNNKLVLDLDGPTFDKFVNSSPKNYSFIIMFTAMASYRRCIICGPAYNEYMKIVNSYHHYPTKRGQNKLYFGIVDADKAPYIFSKMNIEMAPLFVHIPAKGELGPYDIMDVRQIGFFSPTIVKWIRKAVGVRINIYEPPNYSKIIVQFVLFTMILSFMYVIRNKIKIDFCCRQLLGSIAVLFSVTMISGQMWNHIVKPMKWTQNADGVYTFISRKSSYQFVVETYIIILFIILYVIGFVILVDSFTKTIQNNTRQIMIYGSFALMMIMFYLTLSVFKSKSYGYPYGYLII